MWCGKLLNHQLRCLAGPSRTGYRAFYSTQNSPLRSGFCLFHHPGEQHRGLSTTTSSFNNNNNDNSINNNNNNNDGGGGGANDKDDTSAGGSALRVSQPPRRKIQIAVVGSGPSGCYVASYLTRPRNKPPARDLTHERATTTTTTTTSSNSNSRHSRTDTSHTTSRTGNGSSNGNDTRRGACNSPPDADAGPEREIHVDVYERLPVPFGLSRYGVAPDHPEVKHVERSLMKLFTGGGASFIGNLHLGRDLTLEHLLEHYAAVVLSTGAGASRGLGIPGESLPGVLPARAFVDYYNTLPFPLATPRACPFDAERTRRVVVIGNGNVAIDVARVLSAPYEYFCTTDMNCAALRAFTQKRIHSIDIVARRGVERSAFTIAEFRELANFLPERVKVTLDAFNLEEALRAPGVANPRAHKRLMELVKKFSIPADQQEAELRAIATDADGVPLRTSVSSSTDLITSEGKKGSSPSSCAVRFRYHLKPVRILSSPSGRVRGVLFKRENVGDPVENKNPERYCVLPCDLVVTSIGYLAACPPGLPYDEKTGAILHENGRVVGFPRVYVSGWAKNGAKGVILHAIPDAAETAATILHDLDAKILPTEGTNETRQKAGKAEGTASSSTTTMFGKYGLIDYFVERELEPVSIAGVKRILHVETERGIDLGKTAEKLDGVRDMLDIALGGEVGKKTNDRVRGISPARPEPLLYLKELVDDQTDLAPLAKTLAEKMSGGMAEKRSSSPISPFQM